MNNEIERKFLLNDFRRNWDWNDNDFAMTVIEQGYFKTDDASAIRIRQTYQQDAKLSILTVKLPKGSDGGNPEFEYIIPNMDGDALMKHCYPNVVTKRRYLVPGPDHHTWEVDVFEGHHFGMTIAEIELDHIDEAIVLPDWVGQEVTDDYKYTNKYLAFN